MSKEGLYRIGYIGKYMMVFALSFHGNWNGGMRPLVTMIVWDKKVLFRAFSSSLIYLFTALSLSR